MLGVPLIEQCIQNNVSVLALTRKNSNKIKWLPKSNLIEIVECNISDLKSIQLPEEKYDVFYHFAWMGNASAKTRDDSRVHLLNIEYTLDAVELAHLLGCNKFIGAGSQAEYGINNQRTYPTDKVDPVVPYGVAKFAAGKLGRKISDEYGMVYIWPRIFSVYGEHDRDISMIKYAIKQFLSGQPAQFSAATHKWNYLYEKDAGKIFYLLGEKDVPGGVYNVASSDTRPLKDFILEIKDVCNKNAECIFAPETHQPTVSLDPDISSLVHAIGWSPDTTFKQGTINMINKTILGGYNKLNTLHNCAFVLEERYVA